MRIGVQNILATLQAPSGMRTNCHNYLDLIDHIRHGLPPQMFVALARQLEVSVQDLCRALDLPERTIRRRIASKSGALLSMVESERIVRAARVLLFARERLGKQANDWLKLSQLVLLKGEIPLELLRTDIGTKWVEEVIEGLTPPTVT